MNVKRVSMTKIKNDGRIDITVTTEQMHPDNFEGTLSDVSAYINTLILEHGMDARLDFEADHWEAYDSKPSPTYWIKVTRPETDAEWQKRIADKKEAEEKQHARDLAEFERLKLKLKA